MDIYYTFVHQINCTHDIQVYNVAMTHEESTLQTKKTLCLALKELMKHKAFSKITVSELVQTCNYNRKTFYYHFVDMYDLLKWMVEQETFDVVKDYDLLNDYESAISFVLTYLEENSAFLSAVYHTISHEILKELFAKDFHDIVFKLIDNAEAEVGYSISDDFRDFLSDLYIDSTIAMLVNSIKSPDKYDKEHLIEYFNISLPTLIPSAIQAYGNIHHD